MGQQTVEVQIKYTIEGWFYTCMSHPRNGVTQFPTLTAWGDTLAAAGFILASLLSTILARVLGLMTCMEQETIENDKLWVMGLNPYTKG